MGCLCGDSFLGNFSEADKLFKVIHSIQINNKQNTPYMRRDTIDPTLHSLGDAEIIIRQTVYKSDTHPRGFTETEVIHNDEAIYYSFKSTRFEDEPIIKRLFNWAVGIHISQNADNGRESGRCVNKFRKHLEDFLLYARFILVKMGLNIAKCGVKNFKPKT